MHSLSNFGCKIIFMYSVNFCHQRNVFISLIPSQVSYCQRYRYKRVYNNHHWMLNNLARRTIAMDTVMGTPMAMLMAIQVGTS